MRQFLFLLISAAFIPFAHAQKARQTNLEWETIEGAEFYEIEITGVTIENSAYKKQFQSPQPQLNAELSPGNYQLKIRSYDDRKVPGHWSEASEFKVNIEKTQLLSPANNANIISESETTDNVLFRWKKIPNINVYEMILKSHQGQKILIANKEEIEIPIDVAQSYQWQVRAKSMNSNIQADLTEESQFSIQGKQLAAPVIKSPDSEFVRELNWTSDPYAEKHQIILEKNSKDEWTQILKTSTNKNNLTFKKEYSGGRYRLRIQSSAKLRQSSDFSEKEFIVADGDRSFFAEQLANTKRSITIPEGIYFMGRYFISQMNYFTQSAETGTRTSFTAVSGIGGLGMGLAHKNSNFGYIGFIDFGGIGYNDENVTFTSMDLNVIYNLEFATSKLSLQMGFLYKELPFINKNAVGQIQQEQLSGTGLHLGGEYWYAVTSKLGLQVNFHLYELLSKIKTPTNTDFSPSMSTQVGLMGAYRLTPLTTGYVGYTNRTDLIQFKASPTAIDRTDNQVNLSGQYLNLILETRF